MNTTTLDTNGSTAATSAPADRALVATALDYGAPAASGTAGRRWRAGGAAATRPSLRGRWRIVIAGAIAGSVVIGAGSVCAPQAAAGTAADEQVLVWGDTARVEALVERSGTGTEAIADGVWATTLSDAEQAQVTQAGGVVEADAPVWHAEVPWGPDRVDQERLPLDGVFQPGWPAGSSGAPLWIVDSGIAEVSGLAGRVTSGYDAIAERVGPTGDCHGHGTAVAEIAAGGTRGAAGHLLVTPVRVTGCDGGGSTTALLRGLAWIAEQHEDGTAGVVNMSLVTYQSWLVDDAVMALRDEGLIVVVAAGNNRRNACSYSPARAPAAITVGATNSDDTRAWFSNHGTCIDTYAPGVDIPAVGYDDVELLWSGTSMSSPLVAGIAAAVWGANLRLANDDVEAHLLGSQATEVVDGRDGGRVFMMPRERFAVQTGVSGLALIGPVRVLDTRAGQKLAANETRVVETRVLGAAAHVTLTVIGDGAGFLQAWDCADGPVPTSAVNFPAHRPRANTLAVPVTAGKICVRSNVAAHVIVDVIGAWGDEWRAPVRPTRVVDTRASGPVENGVLVVARAVLGAAEHRQAIVNVTVTHTRTKDGFGWVAVEPCGHGPATTSTLNFATGETVANSSIVTLAGDTCITVHGRAHVIVDVLGWVSDPLAAPAQPSRVADTRAGGAVASGGELVVAVPGEHRAVLVNITVTETVSPDGYGYVQAYACADGVPQTSTLNFVTGETRAGAALVATGDGRVCVKLHGTGHVIVDVVGYVQ